VELRKLLGCGADNLQIGRAGCVAIDVLIDIAPPRPLTRLIVVLGVEMLAADVRFRIPALIGIAGGLIEVWSILGYIGF
jgi:hypothetical protein